MSVSWQEIEIDEGKKGRSFCKKKENNIMAKKSSPLDEAFELLEISKTLKNKASMDRSLLDESPSAILNEAANNMFDAFYLIRQHVRTLPRDDPTYSLLQEQMIKIEDEAESLRRQVREMGLIDQDQNQRSNAVPSIVTQTRLHSVDAKISESAVIDATSDSDSTQADELFSAAMTEDERGDIDLAINSYIRAAKMYRRAKKIRSANTNNCSTFSGVESSEDNKLIKSWKERIKLIEGRIEELEREKELDILVESSQVTSGLFYPWSDEKAAMYDFSPSQKYVDPDGMLELSKEQKSAFYTWARPDEIMRMRQQPEHDIKMIHAMSPSTISQHLVSDCSFIAGLCVSAAYESRLEARRIVSSLIHPQDSSGVPIYNTQGIYMVKLWLNGVARRVIIDDYLPVDQAGNLLCSHAKIDDKAGALELWVPILEKAYMKMCGGYDFAGSNSGVDLFALTGWLPEKISLPEDNDHVKNFETPMERCWERLYGASTSNDCLITVATSKDLTEEEAIKIGLHTNHAYAVLEMEQLDDGARRVLLKNPWGRRVHSTNQTIGYRAVGDSLTDCEGGVFWISFAEMTKCLTNINVSWNPDLFRCKIVTHALWKADEGPKDDLFNVSKNPQYIVTLSKEAIQNNATLWVLVSRHVTEQEQKGNLEEDYNLAVDIHRIKAGQRIYYPDGPSCVLGGAYSNNQHILIRYDVKDLKDRLLSIVLRQFNKSDSIRFTLSCYCTEEFWLQKPDDEMALHTTINGKWELRGDNSNSTLQIGTAGGPPNSGSFGSNPQWCVFVMKQHSKLQFKCFAGKDLAINIVFVKTTKKRISHLYNEPLVDTGYRFGFSVSEVVCVPPGMYSLIVSTSKVGEVGSFILQILSSSENIEVN